MFFTTTGVVRYDFKKGEHGGYLYTYQNEFDHVPKFGRFNNAQTMFIVCTEKDILFVNILLPDPKKREIDFDSKEGVANIENVLADENNFYVLANKKNDKLGYYLFMIDLADPEG